MLTIIVILVLILAYAVKMEWTEQCHSYLSAVGQESDSIIKTFRRLDNCLLAESRTVKWRRSYIAAFVGTVLLFALGLQRWPQPKEIILFIAVIYVVYYTTLVNYTARISDRVTAIGRENIARLKKLVQPKHI